MSGVQRWAWDNLLPALLFLALFLVPLGARLGSESYLLALMTRAVALALAALSLDLLIGVGGLVSFGHAAFVGIGTYAVGVLSSYGLRDGALHAATAVATAGVFAAVTGLVAVRTRGVHFIMITLAFGQMLYFLTTALSGFGGDDGMTLPGRSLLFGREALRGDVALYLATVGALLAAYAGLRLVAASRFGRVLAGFRENPVRMQAMGYRALPFQLTAYVIAGAIAAVAGCLLANQAEFVSPATLDWRRSGDLIFMVVLGGLGSLHGAIIGAVVYLLCEEALSGWSEHWRIVFGPLLVLAALFARGGLTGLLTPRGRAA